MLLQHFKVLVKELMYLLLSQEEQFDVSVKLAELVH
jgi:hypothetical protein